MKHEAFEITSRGEWLERRRGDVTASRVAALFDEHPYLTRAGMAEEMRGQSHGSNPAMRRGRILEPAVAAAIEEERPDWQLRKASTYHRLPDYRLGCTPDYWLGDDSLVQVKTVAPAEWERWRCTPPLAYRLQTLTEMLVTGKTQGKLAIMVCSPSYPLYIFDVPRHEGAEARIMKAVAEWWRAWDAGEIAPGAPADEIAAELDDGSHRDLSTDNLLPTILPEREELKAVVSAAEKRLKEIDYEIKNRVGPALSAWVPGYLISYGSQKRKETIIPASEYRVLRIKATQENEHV